MIQLFKKITPVGIYWAERFKRQWYESVSICQRLVFELLPVGRALCGTSCGWRCGEQYDSARVSVTVTFQPFQVMHFPACHGICVNPSGRFPFDLTRPAGSLTAGCKIFRAVAKSSEQSKLPHFSCLMWRNIIRADRVLVLVSYCGTRSMRFRTECSNKTCFTIAL